MSFDYVNIEEKVETIRDFSVSANSDVHEKLFTVFVKAFHYAAAGRVSTSSFDIILNACARQGHCWIEVRIQVSIRLCPLTSDFSVSRNLATSRLNSVKI